VLRLFLLLASSCVAGAAAAQVTLTKGTNFSVDVARDGRLAIDLLGRIWALPASGGKARAVTDGKFRAERPRWAPDASAIVFQARAGNQEQLWLYRFADDSLQNISDGQFFDHQPAWHPAGDRITFSSDRTDTGLDLWELDVATGLTWRISGLPGDETEPAWSSDGRDIVFVHHHADRWSLVLRRHGQPDRVLETSSTPLMSPAWRPDGSLITYLQQGETGLVTNMVILSEPLLVRPLITGEDFFVAPIAWKGRHQMLYTANGLIRKRRFNSWTSSTIPFQAAVFNEKKPQRVAAPIRQLPEIDAPTGRLVIRNARLFDGVGGGYREGLDIVIDGSRITAIEGPRDRPGSIVIDMGNLTALPGFIDGQASLPADVSPSLGPVMLTFGVTTIVTDHARADELNNLWSGKELPGPRVLGADWQLDIDSVSTAALDTGTLPRSPRGVRYEDAQIAPGDGAAMILSGIADSRTHGLTELLTSRQAALVKGYPTAIRRFIGKPRLDAQSSAIIVGSEPNGFAPGVALHAELRALHEAGLKQEFVLRSAGINAATALGLGLQAGRIAPGSAADLVLVDGDPLSDITDTLRVVGVVRNGRFYSTIGLIERAEQARSVE
jgi:hypothetical protein